MAGVKTHVMVIGSGPAGLMAAGQAALGGARVIVLEKNDRPARKLLITGNGRCNLTNTSPLDEFIEHFGRNGRFLRSAFSRFFSEELIQFFHDLGVEVATDDRGRVYPKSNKAVDIAESLLNWALACGAKINYQSKVSKIITENNQIVGVQLSESMTNMHSDVVIIATGGASYPGTGSTGDGYRLAAALGHYVIPIRPSSVPLIVDNDVIHKLQGSSLSDVVVKVKIDGKMVTTSAGDLLFTHFGVSGPVVLSVSGHCVDALRNGNQPILSIDLMPDHDEDQLDEYLLQFLKLHGKSHIRVILNGIMPDKMASLFFSFIGIEPTKLCCQISTKERQIIKHGLNHFDLNVTGYRPLAEAMVTAGGISLKEVDPRTMQSRLIKGLYFAGEVLDLDADTGGYNLQAAFSTGWLAGQSAISPHE